MTNERYLVLSYFLCAALSVAVGVSVYLYLRRPFAGVADTTPGKPLRSILKRLLPFGLVFPALLGFVSVSYQSCSRTNYTEIIESRRYLVQKNQEQISSFLLFVLIAVLFWDVVALLIQRNSHRGGYQSPLPKAGSMEPGALPSDQASGAEPQLRDGNGHSSGCGNNHEI